ncbi:MAG: hypothetical protein KAT58_04460 [candidate division Zixibacteria bacterium]|nr:hypothetical protein [candidate division Zixibacteria bacterium]
MTLEEAIKMAIEYEIRVRDAYLNSIDEIADQTGRRVFQVLGQDEQDHIDYLENRLEEWKKTGRVVSKKLSSAIPSRQTIEEGVKRLDAHLSERDSGTEKEMLRKALALEQETLNFYRRMVDELGVQGKLFCSFVEIEEGHEAFVQAQLDYLSRTGYFFDMREFTMEG